jgi:hypothetical protein
MTPTKAPSLAQQAIFLARKHRAAGEAPFGNLDAAGAGELLLAELRVTDVNDFQAWAAVNAYRNVMTAGQITDEDRRAADQFAREDRADYDNGEG